MTHIYNGTQDEVPANSRRTTDLATVLRLLDHAATLGADYPKVSGVKKARAANDKRLGLLGVVAQAAREAEARMIVAGQELEAGKTDTADVVSHAVNAAALTGDTASEARRHVNAAADAVGKAGADHLRAVTEDQWISPLKPLVAELLAEANEHAAALAITAPAQATVGVVSARHPWSPSRHDLDDIKTRHAWESLEAALLRLDQVHHVATGLRRAGLLLTVEGREWSEDYRWLYLDRLEGEPTNIREFYLANREHGQPGIYRSDELAKGTTRTTTRALGVDTFTTEHELVT